MVNPIWDAGGGGTPEVLATVDTVVQDTTPGGALVFNENPLVSGFTISHQAGSTDIVINQPGIYEAAFHSTVAVASGTPIPATVTVRLEANGVPVPGAVASHTFAASGETGNLSFTVPFQVTATPETIRVVVDNAGFTFSDVSLTVVRLGDTA